MDQRTYTSRRESLRKNLKGGVVLLPGNLDASRNYSATTYRFRQDSHFLYYIGTNLPGMAAIIDPSGEVTMFGQPEDPDDLIWHGPHPVLKDHADASGIGRTEDISKMGEILAAWKQKGETIHYLPPYRATRVLQVAGWLSMTPDEVRKDVSHELAELVCEQRSIKTEAEISEIEGALKISGEMYQAALSLIGPGRHEAEICGAMQGVALKYDRGQSFQPIVSVRGEVLHNESYVNTLEAGQLLLVDSGTESVNHYASDITRTFPVSGTYTEKQKGIYQTVLNAQLAAIENASPRVSNRDIHLIAAETTVKGLIEVGLMKGDPKQAVQEGAHALFFPHGLGHMIGLDVHDMEDLGDVVGYPKGEPRSKQFGLSFLRLAKSLKPGFVITVEPGVYFVPALIQRWKAEKKLEAFINYNEVEKYIGFGGVRLEDDIAITETGCRVLGPGIPKTVEEVEAALRR